ncbi:MAG: DUF1150 family protein [Geminicoccaceae bacterium]|nr:DUF1150 family protein [Geminicoccaceae bacterium]MCB9944202.1 DUF1150 family protein [Geminicoccaceae bacterium]
MTSPQEVALNFAIDLRTMTHGQAYVIPIDNDEVVYYAIFDNEGQPLAFADTRELAFITIRQNGLEPVDAH